MIRPGLRRIAAQVRARLQSGKALTWRDVWAMEPDASRTWAHDTLRKLYRKGEIHVAGWTRSMQGPAMPTSRWGRAWMCRARSKTAGCGSIRCESRLRATRQGGIVSCWRSMAALWRHA